MELPKRKTPRAEWYDYAGGTYFVTVVTDKRVNFFGTINNGEMSFTEIGAMLDNELYNLSEHYKYVRVLNHVVMPNHFHAILYIEQNMLPKQLKDVEKVANSNDSLEKAHLSKNWLSTIVGGLKSSVTRYAHVNNIVFAWQKRFHDHIIRGREDYNLISEYIDENVKNWGVDCYNKPLNVSNKGNWRRL